jgi:lipopolysaccharide/colanic/teichoic acid biosynthesis glycosyltransferase
LRGRAIALGLVEADKAVVVGPGTCGGIDTERFHPVGADRKSVSDLRDRLGIPDDSQVIGFVGRFTRDKGIPELYQAFVSLRAHNPKLHLLLVGDFEAGDPIDPDMRLRIEADRSVIRTGFIRDIALYYRAMDVCVLPTYREGFPGVPLEAQASAIPVITTSATGAIDSVLDGKTGCVVPAGDVNALGQAIGRLLSDPDLRRDMGAAGRHWVESVFRRGIVWTAMKQSYEELLSSHKKLQQCGWRKLVKSLFDRTAALCGLVLLSPLFVAVSAIVYFSVGSPVIFRQMRPGRFAKPFIVYKFRTMSLATDESGKLLPDSERLTRMGTWIRATSLDELPQLWNVLCGDISLVGPRPLLMEYLPRYSAEQARRHDVMPGITGWAQINGRNALSWEEKFALDTWYVDNWSLKLDALILMKTVVSVVRREGIANAGHATMPGFMGANGESCRESKRSSCV